jgi:hypothetical protein
MCCITNCYLLTAFLGLYITGLSCSSQELYSVLLILASLSPEWCSNMLEFVAGSELDWSYVS